MATKIFIVIILPSKTGQFFGRNSGPKAEMNQEEIGAIKENRSQHTGMTAQ
jgi:hypothetical protein